VLLLRKLLTVIVPLFMAAAPLGMMGACSGEGNTMEPIDNTLPNNEIPPIDKIGDILTEKATFSLG
jgi:hypothetical protein